MQGDDSTRTAIGAAAAAVGAGGVACYVAVSSQLSMAYQDSVSREDLTY